MNDGSGSMVGWVLVPLLISVGFYLFCFSWRRRQMLNTFAILHSFSLRPDFIERLQWDLDSCFSLKEYGLVRSFGQLSSLVQGESVWLFRTVELLNLNPHGQSSSTHSSRIVALFDVSAAYYAFFLFRKEGQALSRLPGSTPPAEPLVEITKRIAGECAVQHPMTVTFSRGKGLIYLEPVLVGGETLADVESLYSAAKMFHKELN